MLLPMGRTAAFSSLFLVAALFAGPHAPAAEPGPKKQSAGKEGKVGTTRTGLATYYGKGVDGRKTASGEIFDKTEMVAAHPSYPAGTRARVTNLSNGRSQEVRIIDRGPAPEHQYKGVIIDVSEGAATRLGFRKKGKTRVKVEVLEWGKKQDAP